MKVFYHNDTDGKCAGFFVKKLNTEKDKYPVEFLSINYDKEFPIDRINPDELVYIVDYSIEPSEMDKLLEKTKNVYWIDHHISAIEKYKDYPTEIKGLRSTKYSGCMLTFLYLTNVKYYIDNPDKLKEMTEFSGFEKGSDFAPLDDSYIENIVSVDAPKFLKYIDDYDRWQLDYLETLPFEKGIEIYDNEPTDKIWEKLYAEHQVNYWKSAPIYKVIDTLVEKGETIIAYRRSLMNEYCKKGFETNINGYKAFAVNMGMMSSEDFRIKNIGDYQVLIGFSFDGVNWTYSLRSDKVDCQEIAKTYGGGGHKGAAGFSTDKLILTINYDENGVPKRGQ